MTDTQSPLLAPLRFRNGRTAHNRLWLAPMTNGSSHADGTLSDDEYAFLDARAQGGFSVIESCATHIALDGQAWEGELGCFDDKHIPGWRRLATGIEQRGSLLLGQIFHGGARALPSSTTDAPHNAPWSCSESEEKGTPVREGTPQDIARTIDAFADAAVRLQTAGAHGVELHGAHGYLLCQFLSTELNQRTDEWGGSLENRARFLRDTLRATRAAVRDDFIVGVRLSPESMPSLPGIDLDESVQVAQWLCEDGADFIHISLWDADKNTDKRPDQHAATIFRDALPDEVPIITAGKIWTPADALAQLDRGADAVALGRPAIANPDWPTRVLQQGHDPKRPPLTEDELRDRALSETFITYMKRWDGFVAD